MFWPSTKSWFGWRPWTAGNGRSICISWTCSSLSLRVSKAPISQAVKVLCLVKHFPRKLLRNADLALVNHIPSSKSVFQEKSGGIWFILMIFQTLQWRRRRIHPIKVSTNSSSTFTPLLIFQWSSITWLMIPKSPLWSCGKQHMLPSAYSLFTWLKRFQTSCSIPPQTKLGRCICGWLMLLYKWKKQKKHKSTRNTPPDSYHMKKNEQLNRVRASV